MSPRLTSATFAATGVLFLLYPLLRPSGDDAAALASTGWVLGHVAAMLGFVLLGVGMFGLHGLLGGGAAVLTWVGAGLTLPYYGAETFALNVVAREGAALTAVAQEFRLDPVAATMFALGLLLLAAGTVTAALAIKRSGLLSAWSGMPLAAGFALFLPQFFAPVYALRIAHGVLIAAGALWLAVEVWRSRAA
ncbi:hypothetical protein [Nonomuraea longicatena]|uniref:Uncharacterized protein n=1 Tax=Nonomuraea longicatena TaxID=83682 RepID=A0ABP3ZDP2_9ACTN